MSVAILAVSGNGLTSTLNLSNPQLQTKLIWAKFSASPATFTVIFSAHNGAFTQFAALLPSQFTAGNLSVGTGPGVGNQGFPSQPVWTNWNCFAITAGPAGAGSLIGYWQDNAGGGFKSVATTGIAFTNTNDDIGKNAMPVVMTVAYYMEFNAVLTPTQLQAQFVSATPLIFGSLRRYYILADAVTAGVDSSGNGFNMVGTGLSDGVGLPTFPAVSLISNDYQDDAIVSLYTARKYKPSMQEFWQMPVELRSIIPAVPPLTPSIDPPPRRAPFPVSLLGMELNLLETTLFGQDRVLTPINWEYEWDAPQLPVALRSESSPLGPLEMLALTTFAPYTEYNWPVPAGPRQWNRGYEFSINLNLLGKDKILTTGPNNLQWDPPPARSQPISNRSYEQSALSLFYTVPVKPPLCAEWPLPLLPRRPVQDFIQGTPLVLLRSLTIFPPIASSQDLPPRKARLPATFYSYEWYQYLILRGHDVLPFGIGNDQQNPRPISNRNLYIISERSAFLPPSGPPSTGVRHVGRIVIPPVKLGESPFIPFDFISGLQSPSEVIVSAVTTCKLYSGTDSNPSAIIGGPATVSGSIAFQEVIPTILGNIYDLTCEAVTSAGQSLILDTYLAVVPGVP